MWVPGIELTSLILTTITFAHWAIWPVPISISNKCHFWLHINQEKYFLLKKLVCCFLRTLPLIPSLLFSRQTSPASSALPLCRPHPLLSQSTARNLTRSRHFQKLPCTSIGEIEWNIYLIMNHFALFSTHKTPFSPSTITCIGIPLGNTKGMLLTVSVVNSCHWVWCKQELLQQTGE